MPTWISTVILAVLFVLSLASLTWVGSGWRAWPASERITYLLISAAVWPWVTAGLFTTPPGWYTAIVITTVCVCLTVFLIRQVRFLREGRALIEQAEAAAAELDRRQEPPA